MSRASPLLHIRQLCSLDLNSRVIVPALMEALKSWVPHSAAFFFWADDAGQVFASSASDPGMRELAGRYAMDYANRPEQSGPGLHVAALLQAGKAYVTDFFDEEDDDLNPPLHRDLLGPAGVSRVLACPVKGEFGDGGVLVLTRRACDRSFDSDDKTRLAEVLPQLRAALEPPQRAQEGVEDGDCMLVGGL